MDAGTKPIRLDTGFRLRRKLARIATLLCAMGLLAPASAGAVAWVSTARAVTGPATADGVVTTKRALLTFPWVT